MRWFSSVVFIIAIVYSAHAAYVVNNSGRQINGTKISATADGSVTLITSSGQTMTFRKGQYRSASADRPNELDRAEQLLSDGKENEAVPLLKKVKTECRFLAWDQKAILLLANHYYETGQFAEATAEFQTLEKQTPDVQAKLRESMIKSGDTGAVLAELEKDISIGNREAAAKAYLLRGDLKAANGDPAGARRDWLKVATFFKAQKKIAEQAEAKLGTNATEP